MRTRITVKDRRGIMLADDDSHGNTISQEERKLIDHLVFNRWSPFLTGSEEKVVKFIYAKTVLHYQRWAYVSINMMTYGYPFADHKEDLNLIRTNPTHALKTLPVTSRSKLDEGDLFIISPTGLSRSNVQRALVSLTNKGFVLQNPSHTKTEMALNPDANYSYLDFLMPKRTAERDKSGKIKKRSKLDFR